MNTSINFYKCFPYYKFTKCCQHYKITNKILFRIQLGITGLSEVGFN